MKNYFLVATLTFFSFGANAQELSFEETVNYIREKLLIYGEDDGRYQDKGLFTAKKNGEITFDNIAKNRFNLFDLNDKQKKDWQHPDQFGLYIFYETVRILFIANGEVVAVLYFRDGVSLTEIQRIQKAFIHLRSLCTKVKDPFDN